MPRNVGRRTDGMQSRGGCPAQASPVRPGLAQYFFPKIYSCSRICSHKSEFRRSVHSFKCIEREEVNLCWTGTFNTWYFLPVSTMPMPPSRVEFLTFPRQEASLAFISFSSLEELFLEIIWLLLTLPFLGLGDG